MSGDGADFADGPLSTSGNQILDVNGDAVEIRAVNWFGLESDIMVPHGLWARNWQDMMNEMVDVGFNTIRLPFSHEAIDAASRPGNGVDYGQNPDLQGLTPLQIIDEILDYADEIGLRVILDHHRSGQGAGPNDNGLWYTDAYSEADWIEMWEFLAARYGDHPAVIGADLHNEPHSGVWGGGGANDWARAAEAAGNAVLAVAADWLIIIEGVGSYQGDSYWWGGQLEGVRDRPIELDVAGRLVYSPHDYPASVFDQPWFSDGSDLFEVFREHWGFIYEEGIAPILIGEFGSRLETAADRAWAEAIVAYLEGDFDGDGTPDIGAGEAGMSFAWWSWNPNSGDTGGILNDGWTTLRQNAIELLEPMLDSLDVILGGAQITGDLTEGVVVSGNNEDWVTLPGTSVTDSGIGFDFGDFDGGAYALGGSVTGTAGAGVAFGRLSYGNVLTVATTGVAFGGESGVVIGGRNNLVDNAGSISGGSAGVEFVATRGQNVLQNSGTIFETGSGSVAVQGSGNRDVVENAGTIIGDLRLAGGNDVYRGEGGSVNGVVYGGNGDDGLTGGDGVDRLNGGNGADRLRGFGGDDRLVGGGGGDALIGDGGADRLQAGGGSDDLNGGAGADMLFGGAGADTLRGGAGDDIIVGGAGADGMFGNGGADVFRFAGATGADVIGDFRQDIDLIDIRSFGVTATALESAIGVSGDDATVDLTALGGEGLLTVSGRGGALDAGDFLF
ncbi:cellulase family glycosylhydrolase [Algicella marina]|uniref:cellulase n=1 Tax=Algicella marina TaxID=2683284 RepID=A0A6P1T0E5_9RHOB|nr:cellulase family glycosylhydrolase [Algicella marina]QHQ35477.1 cellulase family glycosylhydrolase [Algicella marina]